MILGAHQYHDRVEAGRVLARQLAHYASRVDTLVLAISPGGVPIAIEVAAYLNAPLDIFMVHALAVTGERESLLGAVASGGVNVYDESAIERTGTTPQQLSEITARERANLERRQEHFRGRRAPPQIGGRVVILVTDGLTTGLATHAAVIAVHRQQPAWLVVAAPVGAVEACEELAQEAHEVVCPLRPVPLQSVGTWYDDFASSGDDELRSSLYRARGLPRP
jgi:putative phosphoribosyl transferase